jgi:NAD(P)-dependent dehydrogenase (short-subunit alcohol dehydrogenase family)
MTSLQRPIGSGFDARSTAGDVLSGLDLSGRTALVTGGGSGLGLETTRALAGAGATVIVPARDPDAAIAATRGIAGVEVDALDLADLASVERFAGSVVRSGRPLDLVIAGAGVMACPEARVGPGWEAQLATNHLGHHALVNHLIPVLTPGRARVVLVSSAGHFLSGIRWDDLHFDRGYDRWEAYAQSKTAVALTAVQLAALGRAHGIAAFSVHPGSVLTPLQRHISREEQLELGWIDRDGERAAGFKTPQQGAATTLWAATAAGIEALSGAYCQDCDVAAPAVDDDMLRGGVKPWATDPDDAARLWALSASMTGVDAFSERTRCAGAAT